MTNTTGLQEIKENLSALKLEKSSVSEQIKILENKKKELYKMPIRLEDFEESIHYAIKKSGDQFSTIEISKITSSYTIGVDRDVKAFSQNFCLEDIEELENGNKSTNSLLWNLGLQERAFNSQPHLLFNLICKIMPEKVAEALIDTIKTKPTLAWGNEDLPTVAERKESIKLYDEELSILRKKESDLSSNISEITDSIQSVLA